MMLTLPDSNITSIRMLSRIFRKYNPLLDLSASRRIAHMVILGQYTKPYRKPKFAKEFHDAIEILKAQPISLLQDKRPVSFYSRHKNPSEDSQRIHLHSLRANQD